MKRRTIKLTPPGTLSRSQIREAVQAAHIRAEDSGVWEVRTLGTGGQTKRFPTRKAAVTYARKISAVSAVVVHDGNGAVKVPRATKVPRAAPTARTGLALEQ